MIYNFEYELKLMLAKAEYDSLIGLKGCDAYSQTNYYFDTDDFSLFNDMVVVRIRKSGGNHELTIKTKGNGTKEHGVVIMDEKNHQIDGELAESIIDGKSDIRDIIGDIGVGDGLHCVGSITTLRKKISINDRLPMAELDKSIYDGIADYELEWEISEENYKTALESLQKFHISLENRDVGLSKYGRLVNRLRKAE